MNKNTLLLIALGFGGYLLYRKMIGEQTIPLVQGTIANCPKGYIYSGTSGKCESIIVLDPVTHQPRPWLDTNCAPAYWNLWGLIPCLPAIY